MEQAVDRESGSREVTASAIVAEALESLMSVGEVTRRTGVTRKALRHYEQLGLVQPSHRTEARYRLYNEHTVRRLELVLWAKGLGLTLAECEEVLRVADRDAGGDLAPLAEIVGRRLNETDCRLSELTALRDDLLAVLTSLTQSNGQEQASVAWAGLGG